MDDALGVRGGKHGKHLVDREEDLVARKTTAEAHAPLFECLTVEQLSHQKQRTVLGLIVVDDLEGPVMPNGISEVALPEESWAHKRVARHPFVKNFHRSTTAIAVRGRIHGGHPADAE
jgi:hypothetical protein